MTWEETILNIIESLGGEGHVQDVYKELPDFRPLSKQHWGLAWGYPAYYRQVRAHIADLREKGELIWIREGCYALTNKGRRRIGIPIK